MPELWAEFHPIDAPDPHGEDYFDLITFMGGAWDGLLDQMDLTPVTAMIGTSQEEHEYANARVPIEKQRPWSDEMANWQDPQDGIDWAEDLLRARADWPDTGDAAYIAEQLETFARVMARAKTSGLKFRLFIGT